MREKCELNLKINFFFWKLYYNSEVNRDYIEGQHMLRKQKCWNFNLEKPKKDGQYIYVKYLYHNNCYVKLPCVIDIYINFGKFLVEKKVHLLIKYICKTFPKTLSKYKTVFRSDLFSKSSQKKYWNKIIIIRQKKRRSWN